MHKYRISSIDKLLDVGDILSAMADSGKTLGLTPAISSNVKFPNGGLIWILKKNNNSGHLEVLYDPGANEINVVPVSKESAGWTDSHAKLVAEYLSGRLGGHIID